MASPHAVVIVSEFGRPTDRRGEGLTLSPTTAARILKRTARDHRCPPGGVQRYPEAEKDFGDALNAPCEGNAEFNGLYGHGIVDALKAVRRP
jgi:hypothetical protein